MTDFGGKTSIFSHPVYLFLRKFSLQDSRGGSTSKKPRKQHSPEFRSEALKLAERIGVTAAARELSLYESQLYNWRSKQQNQQTSSERELEMSTEIARLKRQLAERDEELAILQKAATYFAKRLK
ncbi:transposase [Escherichia coli]|nr:transposase [Escherichia coli]